MAKKMAATAKGFRQTSSVVVDPGGSWSGVIATGDRVRFIDLEGKQAVDFLCYRAADKRDRYNAANTMKMAESAYLNAGTILYGEYATPLMKIVASSCADHDTIGGCCSAEMNYLRYGKRTHACRTNFLHELSKFGMGEADIVANVNWFMNVPVGRDGHMAIAEGRSKPGDYVEVEALTGVIAVISNCPQKYNPASGYNPTPVRVETYTKARAARGR